MLTFRGHWDEQIFFLRFPAKYLHQNLHGKYVLQGIAGKASSYSAGIRMGTGLSPALDNPFGRVEFAILIMIYLLIAVYPKLHRKLLAA